MKLRWILLLAVVGLPLSSVIAADQWSGDGGVAKDYLWTGSLPAKPGIMLRTFDLPKRFSLPAAARAERILYTSTGWPDSTQIITVSGAVFFPKGTPPKGGWPLIAWAHGTTGYADVCAPSSRPRTLRDRQYLSSWLDDGYAIVATDYQGLGTPGPHPYLQYKSEGMSVLDSVRAVQQKYTSIADDKVVIIGQSQGGGAALGTALIAPEYAPEVKIKGTVATGIVAATTNTRDAPQQPVPTLYARPDAYGNSAFEILFFLGTVRSSDTTGIRPEDYISEAAWPLLQKAQTGCLADLRVEANRLKVSVANFYKRPIEDLERIAAETGNFPDVHIPTPVFTGTGLADTDAQTVSQYNFISAMCAAGTRVEWHYYPNATHAGAVPRSRQHSSAFVAAVMQGSPVPDLCAKLVPPGPVQPPDEAVSLDD